MKMLSKIEQSRSSLPVSRQGASDNEVGDYCDYGDYEDVGTPVVPTRVGFLTLTIHETA